jgi:lipid-A-disaccharide synthase-like uncharacterized protein
MLDDLWPLIGTLGIVMLDVSWVSQIARMYRRKRAEDVSVLFPLLNLVGRLLAMAYALERGEAVFTWGFLAGVVVRGVFLAQVLWYRFGRRRAFEGRPFPLGPVRLSSASTVSAVHKVSP